MCFQGVQETEQEEVEDVASPGDAEKEEVAEAPRVEEAAEARPEHEPEPEPEPELVAEPVGEPVVEPVAEPEAEAEAEPEGAEPEAEPGESLDLPDDILLMLERQDDDEEEEAGLPMKKTVRVQLGTRGEGEGEVAE